MGHERNNIGRKGEFWFCFFGYQTIEPCAPYIIIKIKRTAIWNIESSGPYIIIKIKRSARG